MKSTQFTYSHGKNQHHIAKRTKLQLINSQLAGSTQIDRIDSSLIRGMLPRTAVSTFAFGRTSNRFPRSIETNQFPSRINELLPSADFYQLKLAGRAMSMF